MYITIFLIRVLLANEIFIATEEEEHVFLIEEKRK